MKGSAGSQDIRVHRIAGLCLLVLVLCCSRAPTVSDVSESIYRSARAGDLEGPWRNRLSGSASPYLRMHAEDPVDWYPWGDAAFAESVRRGVPVFLSIGFFSCHWCHVMHQETFQNAAIAAFLNDHFVSIKVDREVHPEVDALYMDAVRMLHRQEGWPTSLWLTSSREPFFAGTYFPPTDLPGRPGFRGVIEQIALDWKSRPADIVTHAQKTAERMRQRASAPAGDAIPSSAAGGASHGLVMSWNRNLRGWGEKQQFPMSPRLQFLLDHGSIHEAPEAHRVVQLQLEAMDNGGIHDHIGGGFHRYAADPHWQIPHFEKMLYDNAQLLRLYAEASLALKGPRFAQVARGIADFMLRELQAPQGAFYSSQAAESGGVEGGHYIWTEAELRAALPEPEAFLTAYGVAEAGHFGGGRSVLVRHATSPEEPELAAARATLLEARNRRPRPATDEKHVVAWNGLAIGALSRAGRILGEPRYTAAARQAASHVLAHQKADGSLPRILSDSAPPGVLEDYAFLIEGLLDLFEASPDPRWLTAAQALALVMLERFQDPETGALYQAEARSDLLARRSDPVEVAEPAGAGRAVSGLIRLRALGATPISQAAIDLSLRNNSWVLERAPNSAPSMSGAADRATRGSREVLLAAPGSEGARLKDFLRVYNQALRPHTVLGVVTPRTRDGLAGFSAFTGKSAGATGTRAYVCRDGSCRLPTEDLAEFGRQLAAP